ncbi:MAG: hypothetical protein ACPGGE_07215, partial [Poseidonia sp.]
MFEQVSNIAPRLKVHIVDEQGINRLIEFGNESTSRALRNVVEKIETDLPRFLQIKEEIECEGLDLIVRSLFEQYEGWNGGWKKAFLSNAVDELGVFSCRRERWFLRPETLFDNPYSHRTNLAIGDAENAHSKGIKTPVIVHEALHSYLPGTWTLRNGDLRLKIKTGPIESSEMGHTAFLDKMEEAGSRFRVVHGRRLPAAPGAPGGVKVFAPQKLMLKRVARKLVPVSKGERLALDGDEAPTKTGHDHAVKDSKIPKSNPQTWVFGDPSTHEVNKITELGAYLPSGLKFTTEDGEEILPNDVKHALESQHLDRVERIQDLEVIEYTHGVTRQFAGLGEEPLRYADSRGRGIG